MNPDTDLIMYTTEDGATKVEATFDGDTVWLSQEQMAELFQRDKSTISRHIKNIYDERELSQQATVANFATVQNEDYTSDLDAENIYHIILEGSTSAQAFSSYYTSLANGSNRSVIFKTHIAYETVRNKVFTELIDAQILYWMSYYSNEGNFVMVQSIAIC